ncbi:fibrinogen-like protein A [Physella acuta]|uniref:fibrinogen-like protein A n=1 Tax=Physella acuta TaxID=109671 RepID=UPI0027DAD6A4|nr:fibrinogen-like protein A [Physella acuta]
MGTLKMYAGAFALYFFLGSGVFATDQPSLSDILIKLQAMQGTINENRNKLQSIPSKLQDLKETLQAIPSKFEYFTESLQDNHIKLETIEGTVQDNQNRLLAIPNKLQTLQETVQDNKKLLDVLEMLTPIPIETCKVNMDRPLFRKYYHIHGEKLALCDTETDGGGWVVIQRRIKGDVLFNRTWEEYKQGFGSVEGDFWIGNEKISSLTMMGYNELRFDMKYKGASYYMIYSNVKVGNEADLYRIMFTFKTGNAKDNFSRHNGIAFSTFDRDNDAFPEGHCARDLKSGWWFKMCLHVNMNGVWASKVFGQGISWGDITDYNDSLEYVEMKLRRL